MTCFCFNDSVKYQYVNYENMITHEEQRGYQTDVEEEMSIKLCAIASQKQLYTHAPASQEKLDKASELQLKPESLKPEDFFWCNLVQESRGT